MKTILTRVYPSRLKDMNKKIAKLRKKGMLNIATSAEVIERDYALFETEIKQLKEILANCRCK